MGVPMRICATVGFHHPQTMASQTVSDNQLADWRDRARRFEQALKSAVVGQDRAIHLITLAVFARGHVLLEGDVGVGKTTLLRAVARAIGGAYERIEGTVDLMPTDLVYYTYIGEDGRPRVDAGPILKHGAHLATFFFNEINRARPQVHSLLLRIMAERSVNAFNREYHFPHLQVFADRNRIEKEETFEISSAARDRFLMEIQIETPSDVSVQTDLMFNTRFHDGDALISEVPEAVMPYTELNGIGELIQDAIGSSPALQDYAARLWSALRRPAEAGIRIEGINTSRLVEAGASPRGMSLMLRAARVEAWLQGRTQMFPEDLHGALQETVAHRVFLYSNYEMKRAEIVGALLDACRAQIAAP
jgi:MoxR-like ATPase